MARLPGDRVRAFASYGRVTPFMPLLVRPLGPWRLMVLCTLLCGCVVPRNGLDPSCEDGFLNQDETDVDCGGNLCAACINEALCLRSRDCRSGICDTLGSGICEPANMCGNGHVEGDEACDDGNVTDEDGCNADCLKEAGEDCGLNAECETEACDATFNMQCVLPGICGNGMTEGGEGCDDGNTRSGDECDENCQRELGQPCANDNQCSSTICDATEETDVCEAANTCGNSRLEGSEICDDGNRRPSDGCSPLCLRDNGEPCSSGEQCASGACDTTFRDECVPSGVCGNGIREPGEGCDDGNTRPNDDCDDNCLKELGQPCERNADCGSDTCDLRGSGECEPAGICGNGSLDDSEGCDDGNRAPNDDCNEACFIENGAQCGKDLQCASIVCDRNEVPWTCEPANTCGNGKIEGSEACDDGGTEPGGGCSALCLYELGEPCDDDDECDLDACGPVSGTCLIPECGNIVRDRFETDTNCGGTECDPCQEGRSCAINEDCISLSCRGNVHRFCD